MDVLQADLDDLAATFGKPVLVADTAYPFTLASNDSSTGLSFSDSSELDPGYRATLAGQAANFGDVLSVVQAVPNGLGLGAFYWEPTWTVVPGNGWDPTNPSSGDGWENQAMWNYSTRRSPRSQTSPRADPEQGRRVKSGSRESYSASCCPDPAVTAQFRHRRDSRTGPMSNETLMGSDSTELDMTQVEIGLAVLREACRQAVDELGGAVPEPQLRALLIFEDAGGSLDMRQLAAELIASVRAASKMCDRMRQAGLVTVEDIATSEAAPGWVLTDSGARLARWLKDRRRMALSKVVYSMRPHTRDALIYGLTELAAVPPEPS